MAEYKAGLNLAIARGWLWLHESGTYVRFMPGRRGAVPVDGKQGLEPPFRRPDRDADGRKLTALRDK